MASLVSAKTALTPRGTPGHVAWFDWLTTPRSYVATWTQLYPGGRPGGRRVTFTHATSSSVDLNVSDTANLSATESPVDSQEIATTDTARLTLNDVSQLFNFMASSDTTRLAGSETVSLVISGVTDKPVADTTSLSVSESVAISVSIDVTDIASIQLTGEAGTVATSVEAISVTDTASFSVDDQASLNVFTGLVDINVTDEARLAAADHATAVEVSRIKRITLDISMPRIEMEII